jgi:hypothetical protein
MGKPCAWFGLHPPDGASRRAHFGGARVGDGGAFELSLLQRK